MCDGFCNGECTVEDNTPGCACPPGQALHIGSCEICPGSLHLSVQTGNSQCVRYRLSQGDDVDEMVNGTSSLYQAVRHGFSEIVEVLVEEGADFEQKTDVGCLDCTRGGDTRLFHFARELTKPTFYCSYLVRNGINYQIMQKTQKFR